MPTELPVFAVFFSSFECSLRNRLEPSSASTSCFEIPIRTRISSECPKVVILDVLLLESEVSTGLLT